jgi:hypothetical protein
MWLINFEKVKGQKAPAIDQIPAELIKAGDKTISSDIQTSESSVVYIYRKVIKQIAITIEAYNFYQLCTQFCPNPSVKFNSIGR